MMNSAIGRVPVEGQATRKCRQVLVSS